MYAHPAPQKLTRYIYVAACSERGVLNAFAARLEVEQFRQAVGHLNHIAMQSSVVYIWDCSSGELRPVGLAYWQTYQYASADTHTPAHTIGANFAIYADRPASAKKKEIENPRKNELQ